MMRPTRGTWRLVNYSCFLAIRRLSGEKPYQGLLFFFSCICTLRILQSYKYSLTIHVTNHYFFVGSSDNDARREKPSFREKKRTPAVQKQRPKATIYTMQLIPFFHWIRTFEFLARHYLLLAPFAVVRDQRHTSLQLPHWFALGQKNTNKPVIWVKIWELLGGW